MTRTRWSPPGLGLSCLATLALAACATPHNAALDQAHANYQSASQDPVVIQSAAPELQRAKSSLDTADAALKNGRDPADVSADAYVANQQVATAQTVADATAHETAIRQAEGQRTRVELSASEAQAAAAQQQAGLAQQQVAALQAQLKDVQARQTDQGTVLTLGNVLFKTNEAELTSGASGSIDRVVQFLKQTPNRGIRINGYTDSQGNPPYNLGLSQARADAVKAAFVNRGIDPARIQTEGYGEASPVADNGTAEGRQMNRRVEIVVANPPATTAATSGSSGTLGTLTGGTQ